MKSITIHGIDPALDKKIAEKSKEYGLSQNRTVKEILQKSLLGNRKLPGGKPLPIYLACGLRKIRKNLKTHPRV